ncbi:unnamed protein product [Ectocarpus fasciculatus]
MATIATNGKMLFCFFVIYQCTRRTRNRSRYFLVCVQSEERAVEYPFTKPLGCKRKLEGVHVPHNPYQKSERPVAINVSCLVESCPKTTQIRKCMFFVVECVLQL